MTKQIVAIHVGQCGNQIGVALWQSLLQEYAERFRVSKSEKNPVYDSSMASVFCNTESSSGEHFGIGSHVSKLRARAVLVDMEENVISQSLRSSICEIFDSRQIVSDVSGSGNNWACAYMHYGQVHGEAILDSIRREVELCDDPCDAFLMTASIMGGTGSGLGSFILESLSNFYPKISRNFLSVVPSCTSDDVVTAPYNAVLALSKMKEFASTIIPVDNSALSINCKDGGFGDINSVISNMFIDISAPARFKRELHYDLSDLGRRLVPSPDLNFLIPSTDPKASFPRDVRMQAKAFDEMFAEIHRKENCLLSVDTKKATTAAFGMSVRVGSSAVGIHDVYRNVDRLERHFPRTTRFDNHTLLGVTKSFSSRSSMCILINSSAIVKILKSIRERFDRMHFRRAHLHHYAEYMDLEEFETAAHALDQTIREYSKMKTLS